MAKAKVCRRCYKRPVEERFWSKVVAFQRTLYPTPCWEWQGYIGTNGYGQLFVKGVFHYQPDRQMIGAHVFAYWLKTGTLPKPGKWVLHRCDNRACVRPSHLYEGTPTNNNQDSYRRGRQPRGVNTRAYKNGRRSGLVWHCNCKLRAIAIAEFDATCNKCGGEFVLQGGDDD